MSKPEGQVLDQVTRASHLHDVRVTSPGEMSDMLRMSYLMTLPFFNTVALLTNLLILCSFSTARVKKYRASVFFRYVALVDAGQSCVIFGLMWLALAAPESNPVPTHVHAHCRMYTVLRYTMQDLSAYGLVCLLMERCSAMSSRTSRRPSCVLLTLCRFQCLIRHLSCKLFLLSMSLLTLVLNMGIVLSDQHELEQLPVITDCFNTWKSPKDFTYDFRSLAMNHALLSMVIPAMCCVVSYLCLRVLLSRNTSLSPAVQMLRNVPQGARSTRPGGPVLHTRWIHLGLNTPTDPPTTLPPRLLTSGSGSVAFPLPPPSTPTPTTPTIPTTATTATTTTTTTTPRVPTLTMMSVDEVQSHGEDSNPAQGSCLLDRLYAMIKRREVVLSVVCVEDSRLASVPPPDLSEELNAMASIAAVSFILIVQPQLLLMMVGCIMRSGYHRAVDWSLVKNIGLAADLIFNNRISFTFFLFLFVSGKRLSTYLLDFLRQLSACWCCRCLLLFRRGPWRGAEPHSQSRARFGFPRAVLTRPDLSVLLRPPEGPPPPPETGGGRWCPPSAPGGDGEGQQVEVVPKMSIMTPS